MIFRFWKTELNLIPVFNNNVAPDYEKFAQNDNGYLNGGEKYNLPRVGKFDWNKNQFDLDSVDTNNRSLQHFENIDFTNPLFNEYDSNVVETIPVKSRQKKEKEQLELQRQRAILQK